MNEEAKRRCGFIAVVGVPNVGKSALVNRIVGSKVTIVSPKVQTTRSRVMGIAMRGLTQIVFVDTPGIFKPHRRLEKAMVRAAWTGVGEADLLLLVADSRRGLDDGTRAIIERLASEKRRAILALNKIDLVERPKLLPLAAEFEATGIFDRIFMVSALKGDGLGDLLAYLEHAAPEGEWMFPEDQVSDLPMRLWAAEITREKLFLRLHQELPYSIAVETGAWEERKDGSLRIEQVILVDEERRKGMVVGNNGAMIKEVGTLSRTELERELGRRVHLFLTVEYRPGWKDDRRVYAGMGLEFDV